MLESVSVYGCRRGRAGEFGSGEEEWERLRGAGMKAGGGEALLVPAAAAANACVSPVCSVPLHSFV